jgi:hypothetical protein
MQEEQAFQIQIDELASQLYSYQQAEDAARVGIYEI